MSIYGTSEISAPEQNVTSQHRSYVSKFIQNLDIRENHRYGSFWLRDYSYRKYLGIRCRPVSVGRHVSSNPEENNLERVLYGMIVLLYFMDW